MQSSKNCADYISQNPSKILVAFRLGKFFELGQLHCFVWRILILHFFPLSVQPILWNILRSLICLLLWSLHIFLVTQANSLYSVISIVILCINSKHKKNMLLFFSKLKIYVQRERPTHLRWFISTDKVFGFSIRTSESNIWNGQKSEKTHRLLLHNFCPIHPNSCTCTRTLQA